MKLRDVLKLNRNEKNILAAAHLLMDAVPEIRERYNKDQKVGISIKIKNLPDSIAIQTAIIEVAESDTDNQA